MVVAVMVVAKKKKKKTTEAVYNNHVVSEISLCEKKNEWFLMDVGQKEIVFVDGSKLIEFAYWYRTQLLVYRHQVDTWTFGCRPKITVSYKSINRPTANAGVTCIDSLDH